MNAVTSGQSPPTDLLLSLMLGMVGGPAIEGTTAATGKSGEFAGLLDLLEGDSFAAEELPKDGAPPHDLQQSADGQLNSLMAASLASATFPNQTTNSREVGSSWMDLTRPTLRSEGAIAGGMGTGPSAPAKAGELPGAGLGSNGNMESAKSLGSGGSATAERLALEAQRLQAADASDQLALGAGEQTAVELAAQGSSTRPSSERTTRSNSHRESHRTASEGSWQSELDATSTALPQNSLAVTAMSAGTPSRQDSLHAALSDAVESSTGETLQRRPEQSVPANVSLLTPESSGLVELQGEFESHLEQLVETFPLDSVAAQIATAVEPDAGWITVEIQPPELGRLEIMVSKQGDDYLARIVAHEAATSDALNLQREQLIDALGQHGLELKEVQISSETNSGNGWTQTDTQQESNQGRERQGYGEDRSQSGSNRQADAPNSPPRAPLFRAESGEQKQVNLLV